MLSVTEQVRLYKLDESLPVEGGTDLLSMLEPFLLGLHRYDVSLNQLGLLWTLVQETCQTVVTSHLRSK